MMNRATTPNHIHGPPTMKETAVPSVKNQLKTPKRRYFHIRKHLCLKATPGIIRRLINQNASLQRIALSNVKRKQLGEQRIDALFVFCKKWQHAEVTAQGGNSLQLRTWNQRLLGRAVFRFYEHVFFESQDECL